ncbi:MAG: TIGR00730 family Rossman fold protein [Planctomycetota bacterium]
MSRHDHERRFLNDARNWLGEIARSGRIWSEFTRAAYRLRGLGPCVTVFGSARFKEDHRYYQLARDVGRELGEAGFTVMTGGGPGVMEAANRGARDAGAPSIGCNIILPHEQQANPYVDRTVNFNYFFIRKVMLMKYSCAFVLMPGGFGTMDEAFEAATLIQTGKIERFPVVACGSDYWGHLRTFLRDTMIRNATIDDSDLDMTYPTDDPRDAAKYIVEQTGIGSIS